MSDEKHTTDELERLEQARLKQTEAEADRLLAELKAIASSMEDERSRTIGGWAGLVIRQDNHEKVATIRARWLHERVGRMLVESQDDYWTTEERAALVDTAILAAKATKAVVGNDEKWKRESKRVFREELVKLGAPDIVTDRMLENDLASAVVERDRKLARKAVNAYLDAVGASTPGDRGEVEP